MCGSLREPNVRERLRQRKIIGVLDEFVHARVVAVRAIMIREREERGRAFLVFVREQLLHGVLAQDVELLLVADAELGVEVDRLEMALQDTQAEAVHRRNRRAREQDDLPLDVLDAVGLVLVLVRVERLLERSLDALAHLARRRVRERHDEQLVDVAVAVQDLLDDALDEHGRLAGAGRRCDDEVLAFRIDGFLLIL